MMPFLNECPQTSFNDILKILESNIEKCYEKIKHLNETPMASASIAQVHEAELQRNLSLK